MDVSKESAEVLALLTQVRNVPSVFVTGAVMGAVTVIFTALTAIFTWMAARQAGRSAAAAEESLRISTRPWLGVTGMQRTGVIGPQSPLFMLHLKNFGSLPAFLVEHRLNRSVGEPRGGPQYHPGVRHPDDLILNPNQEIAVVAPGPALNQNDVDVLKSGERLFVWFEILYRDPRGRDHHLSQIARSNTPALDSFTWIPKENYWTSD